MRLILKSAVASAALPILITACSTASSTGSAPTAKATTPAASPTPVDPNAGLFTGTQLKAMLAPASYFPSGFKPDASGSVNTGDNFQPASPPGKLPCSRMDGTSWIDLSDIGSVSFAQSDFVNQTTVEEYAQEIDEFQGTAAQAVMANLRTKVAKSCARFTDPQTGARVSIRLGKGLPVGDDALSFTLTSPNWRGGTTLEAVRTGTAVVTVFFSSASGVGATQARALVRLIVGKMRQKSAG